jgi:hypothetical protein
VILADPTDPYYALAEEIARQEALSIVGSLNEALARDPAFLLWVVSPARLSDQAIVAFSLAMRERPSAISVGIISGSTLENARALWQRAGEVKGQRLVAVNAANPSGHIEAKITIFDQGQTTVQPLTKPNLAHGLQNADYLIFTGHGGRRSWGLDEDTTLYAVDIPPLPPVVIGTASCNTFRIWESESIALACTDQGAAAYAGFAYSPNEGYLIGEFDGLPFRYTWPDFPIGHVVQVQNHGTLQGFANFPYYYLLGDPRIALQVAAPYRLVDDRQDGDVRILTYAGAPAGLIPVRIPGGARYDFVDIPGVTAAGEHDRFYNSRLQMANIGEDKYILLAHQGGDFTVRLAPDPSVPWAIADLLTDSLDHTLLYSAQTGGDVISLFPAGLALVGIALLLWRRKARGAGRPHLALAVLTAAAFTALHGLYAFIRLGHVTVTSKLVEFSPLSLVGTFLLVGCGAFLFLYTRSWWARGFALLVATFPAWAAAAFGLGFIAFYNLALFRPALGASVYNYNLGLLSLVTFVLESILFATVFFLSRRWLLPAGRSESRTVQNA